MTIRGEQYGFADRARQMPAYFEIRRDSSRRFCRVRARRRGACSSFSATWQVMGPLRFDYYCDDHLPPKHKKYVMEPDTSR